MLWNASQTDCSLIFCFGQNLIFSGYQNGAVLVCPALISFVSEPVDRRITLIDGGWLGNTNNIGESVMQLPFYDELNKLILISLIEVGGTKSTFWVFIDEFVEGKWSTSTPRSSNLTNGDSRNTCVSHIVSRLSVGYLFPKLLISILSPSNRPIILFIFRQNRQLRSAYNQSLNSKALPHQSREDDHVQLPDAATAAFVTSKVVLS